MQGLTPGDNLPELPVKTISTQTKYQYNEQQNSATYGQLSQLTLVKYPEPAPIVHGALLNFAATSVPEKSKEQFTVKVTHQVDPLQHTRTTVLAVAPETSPDQRQKTMTLLQQAGGGLSLGTSVYSLTSGVKLASDDTLKTVHTAWRYDHWNRPVTEMITPTEGGQPQTTQWSYINTLKETSVVKTLPSGTQLKGRLLWSGKGSKGALYLAPFQVSVLEIY